MSERMVIDSSVAAKWFLKDEVDIDLADDILAAFLAGDIQMHAPCIIAYEVSGLLAKACAPQGKGGKPRLSKEDAVACVRRFYNLSIQVHEVTAEEHIRALEMSIDCSKGYYDMAYIQLAEKLSCQWCTADRKFCKPFLKTFHHTAFSYSQHYVSSRVSESSV